MPTPTPEEARQYTQTFFRRRWGVTLEVLPDSSALAASVRGNRIATLVVAVLPETPDLSEEIRKAEAELAGHKGPTILALMNWEPASEDLERAFQQSKSTIDVGVWVDQSVNRGLSQEPHVASEAGKALWAEHFKEPRAVATPEAG